MTTFRQAGGRAGRALLAASALALAGCATGPQANPRDPLEPFNRQMLKFNEGVDSVVLKPAATVYREQVPPIVRTGVSNFFGNLGDAWSAVNSALQLKVQNAAENWMRFAVNTMFGLGGVLDIASDFNIERHKEDFGQTLGRWGVPAGPYIMLPFLGPSTLRDTLAIGIDRRGNLVQQVDPAFERNSLYVLRAVDVRSNLLRVGDVLEGAALDKYTFTRDAYLQRRRAEITESSGRSDGRSDGQEPADTSTAPAPTPVPAPSR